MKTLLKLGTLFALYCCVGAAFASTWFVRTDGGPIYYSGLAGDSCDGLADTAMTVSGGANQHCAVMDYRYLYDTGQSGNWAWRIAGGDTVVVRGCKAASDQQNPNNPTCRVGWDMSTGPGTAGWCLGGPANTACTNPPIPAGSSGAHTKILAGCAYDNNPGPCHSGNTTTNANLVQLHGGFGVGGTLTLSSTQYVDVAGFELTDQAQCAKSQGISNQCVTSTPLDDYAVNGLQFDTSSANITVTDLNIHGLGSNGIIGAIGGDIAFTRTRVASNTSSGWDLTPGGPSTGGIISMSYALFEWNGCVEEYPIVHNPSPYICFDQSSAGYGDAIGTAGGDAASFFIQNSIFRYNTQDGPDLLHSASGSFIIQNSQSYGNEGQQIKLGPTSNSTVQNSLIVGNCNVLAPGNTFPGARPGFNVNLGNTCRAGGDNFRMDWGGSSTVFHFDYNTVIAGGADLMVIPCDDLTSCATGTKTLRNNVFIGYAVTGYNADQAPGTFCYSSCAGTGPPASDDTMWTSRFNNYFYTFRACPSPLRTGETCNNPQLTTQLSSPTTNSLFQYSAFNFYPGSGSPIIGTGTAISGITTDFYGVTRPNPPSIGAAEPANPDQTATPSITPSSGTVTLSVTLADTTPSAVICYNFTGSPATNGLGTGCAVGSTQYTTTLSVSSVGTLYVIAQAPSFTSSAISTGTYTAPAAPQVTVSGALTISGSVTVQ